MLTCLGLLCDPRTTKLKTMETIKVEVFPDSCGFELMTAINSGLGLEDRVRPITEQSPSALVAPIRWQISFFYFYETQEVAVGLQQTQHYKVIHSYESDTKEEKL